MRFLGKKVFVTGASRGIGRVIAELFMSEGAEVVGTRTSLNGTVDMACSDWIIADFSSLEQIRKCTDFIDYYGPDILINNAGINKISAFTEIIPEEFRLVQQVNVFAPFSLCQAAIPSMIKKNWGRIVNISSIWGKISKAHRATYSASKFALDGMTVSLAAEHAVNGILANCVAPGFIDTELTRSVLGEVGIEALLPSIPVNRLGQANEIANLVLWLSSKENTYLTGQNIAVDGGFSRV